MPYLPSQTNWEFCWLCQMEKEIGTEVRFLWQDLFYLFTRKYRVLLSILQQRAEAVLCRDAFFIHHFNMVQQLEKLFSWVLIYWVITIILLCSFSVSSSMLSHFLPSLFASNVHIQQGFLSKSKLMLTLPTMVTASDSSCMSYLSL